MADRFPEAELVLDDELMYEDSPRCSAFLRRTDDRVEQIVREGEVLAGKYRVERIPGRNGLGVLVHVRHMELAQEVTLKFLVPDACAYPEFVQRFVREARSAVRIQGEHVARVTDVGRLESGAPYMVREFLRGPDLAEVTKVRGRLPVAEAVDYVIQACEGVAEGHALGVVHRNIKPTSLVVTRRSDGTPLVKVFDFAAAESLHVDPFTERAVSLVGTSAIMASLPYLAPEQIRDPHDVDVRADIYSLGAVLFELLTGTPVYSADTAPALLAMVAADAALPVRHFVVDAPGELDHIVLRCLSKNRAIRYASIADLALALRPFATDEATNSIDRIVRLDKLSNRPAALSAPRPASQPPSSPSLAPPPASPFTPSPSAMPPAVAAGRGPTGTVMLHMTEPARPSARVQEPSVRVDEVGNDDLTAIGAHAVRNVPPLVISPPVPATGRDAPRYTPQPPPLRPYVPPPLRAAPPQPSLAARVPPPAVNSPEPRMDTSIPPSRSSVPGLARSWAVPDEPPSPSFLTRNRLIGIGVVAACATLGVVMALRAVAPAPAPMAAARPARIEAPAPAPVPPAAAVAPAESAAPVASTSPVPAPAAAPAAAAAPVAAAPIAPAPVAVAPALVAPRAAAPAPVAHRPAVSKPAKPNVAEAPAQEKIARARPAAGPDLFDDPR